MTETEYQRYWKRANRYGYTPEEAYHIPKRVPRWMFRVEREEGISFASFLRREIKCGASLKTIAISIGVHHETLYHHVRKFRKAGMLS